MATRAFGFRNEAESSPKTTLELLKALKEAREEDWVKEIHEQLEASEKISQSDLNLRVR